MMLKLTGAHHVVQNEVGDVSTVTVCAIEGADYSHGEGIGIRVELHEREPVMLRTYEAQWIGQLLFGACREALGQERLACDQPQPIAVHELTRSLADVRSVLRAIEEIAAHKNVAKVEATPGNELAAYRLELELALRRIEDLARLGLAFENQP